MKRGSSPVSETSRSFSLPRSLRTSLLVVSAFAGGALTASLAHATSGESSPYAILEQLARVLVIVENEYVDPVPREKLLDGAIKGMVAELDPHSAYMPADDNAVFKGETQGKFGGVGLEVEMRDDRLIVIAPIEGSPAERAGIKPGDRILSIAGESSHGANLDKLVRKMRGVPGTSIELTLLTPGTERARTLTLVREEIHVTSVTWKRLTGDIAYIRVKQFQADTHDEMLRAIGKLRASSKSPLTGVILDLRTNPGGLVDQAVGVADEFLGAGTIYTTRSRGKVIDEVSATSGGGLVSLPAVVLVNEYSASASELVAGALQDHKRAIIVGAQTFGKGSVQSILDLPGGTGMRLTTMRYYTPSGRTIQAVGITPDVAVEPKGDKTPLDQIVKESDLDGYLPPREGDDSPPPRPPRPSMSDGGDTKSDSLPDASSPAGPDGGADPKPRESDFGVARKVPEDPSTGPDHVLSVGYQLVKTLAARRK